MFPSAEVRPCIRQEDNKYEYLYKMLRPELVQKSPTPINPDWTRPGMHTGEDAASAWEQFNKLQGPGDDIIPYRFADVLVDLKPIKEYTDDLSYRAHSMGINLRHLGLVHERLVAKHPEDDWRCRVAVEIIARSFRKIIVETQHEHPETVIHNNNVLIVDNLNLLLKDNAEGATRDLWEKVNADIRSRFVFREPYEFTIDDLKRRPFGRPTFMARITDLLGLVWYNDAWTAFTNIGREKEFFEGGSSLLPYSLKEIQPRVKQMNIAYHLIGVIVEYKVKDTKIIPPYIQNTIVQSFKSGLERIPSSTLALRRYAKALDTYVMGLEDSNDPASKDLRAKVDATYNFLANDKSDTMSIYYAAVYFDAKGNLERAKELYEDTTRSKRGNCFLMLGNLYAFTEGVGNAQKAEEVFNEGIKCDSSSKCNIK